LERVKGIEPSYRVAHGEEARAGVLTRTPQNDVERWLESGQFNFYGPEVANRNVSSYHRRWGAIDPFGVVPSSTADHNVNIYGLDFWNSLLNQANSGQLEMGINISICDFIGDLDRIVGP